jgi:hypothetical protein
MSVTEVATAEAASAASTDVTASEAITVEQVLSAEASSLAATDVASEAITVEQVLSAEASSIAAYTLTATTVTYTMTFDLIALLYLLLLAASIKKLAELV